MWNRKAEKTFVTAFIAALTVMTLTACGGQAYREADTVNDIAGSVIGGTTGGSSGGGVVGVTGTNLLPPIRANFTLTGASGTSPSHSVTVTTDNILKIRINSGSASQLAVPGYSNFSAQYNCITYIVNVLGQDTQTQTLSVNGGNCSGAEDSQVIDLSNRLTPGHGSVTITVRAGSYDFYCTSCLSQPWLYNAYPYGPYSCSYYCPLKTVYKTHTVTGSLDIQVNGTSL